MRCDDALICVIVIRWLCTLLLPGQPSALVNFHSTLRQYHINDGRGPLLGLLDLHRDLLPHLKL